MQKWTRSLVRTIATAMPICALILSQAACAQDVISSHQDLQAVLEKAVTCRVDALNKFNGSEFDGSPGDVRTQLENLGVEVNSQPPDNDTITYRFPAGVKVFGYEASEATSSAESVTTFFISLRAGADHLRQINKTLRLTGVTKGNPDGYGYFGKFNVRYIRKLSNDKNGPPDTIFSGTENIGKHVVIGCQNLAW
jgi:hypothetical protein